MLKDDIYTIIQFPNVLRILIFERMWQSKEEERKKM